MGFRNAVLRAVPGAFFVNAGIGKLSLPPEAAAHLQAMGAKGIPQLAEMPPEQFGKLLAYAEIAVGTALLTPFVPSRLAGAALTGFSAGLLTMYLRTPELTEADGVRPTQEGTAIAKDSWLLAIGLALLVGGKDAD
jgi:uncharacterized membrane protein YphA (DoxX/SURF4 family)